MSFSNLRGIGREILIQNILLTRLKSKKLFFLPKVTISNNFRDIDVQN